MDALHCTLMLRIKSKVCIMISSEILYSYFNIPEEDIRVVVYVIVDKKFCGVAQ
jgi:hypothetical protein